jgi:hypothetical protein
LWALSEEVAFLEEPCLDEATTTGLDGVELISMGSDQRFVWRGSAH